jgi:lincosamide nucleotidyltransferase A/C/D/E
MMTAADVVRVLDVLGEAGIVVWLDGGWGVDALVGEETREHHDLDTVVSAEHLDRAVTSLAALGYEIAEDFRPTRMVLAVSDGRRIDFHPVVFDEDGSAGRRRRAECGDAVYPADGFAGNGSVGGRSVACLTPLLLVRHHLGYEPQEKDRHNVALRALRHSAPAGLPLTRLALLPSCYWFLLLATAIWGYQQIPSLLPLTPRCLR